MLVGAFRRSVFLCVRSNASLGSNGGFFFFFNGWSSNKYLSIRSKYISLFFFSWKHTLNCFKERFCSLMFKIEISWLLFLWLIVCYMGGFWIYFLDSYYSGPTLLELLHRDFICRHFHILAHLESGRSPPKHLYNPVWIYKCHLQERQPQAHETQMKSPLITDLLVHDRNWQVTHQGWKPGK